MSTSFLHQQPLLHSAAVRSLPSPQHGALLEARRAAQAIPPRVEEKSFAPVLKR